MLITSTLIVLLVCLVISTILILIASVKIKNIFTYDNNAKKYAVTSTVLGFAAIIIFIYSLLYLKLGEGIYDIYYYSFIIVVIIMIVNTVLSFLSYRQLVESYAFKTEGNDNNSEMNIVLASFCFNLIGLASVLTYITSIAVNRGYFPGIKDFLDIEDEQVREDLELENIMTELDDINF